MVSQGYDGASVMSGQCSGVQKWVRRICSTYYLHSLLRAHSELSVDKLHQNGNRIFLSIGITVCVYIDYKGTCCFFLQKQRELHSDKQPFQLQRLSDTRWACRYAAVNALCHRYDSVLATLEEIGD